MVNWILTCRSIPQGLDGMRAIQSGDFRNAIAGWRKAFKQDWKQCEKKMTNSQCLLKYYTDPENEHAGVNHFFRADFFSVNTLFSIFET